MSEHLFEFSNTNDAKKLDGELGNAKKIERLLLQRPSFINGGGVNIRKYKFEHNSESMIDKIRSDVSNQVRQHLPSISVNEVQLERREDGSLLIGFNIGIDKEFIFGVIIPDDATVASQLIY